MGIVYEAYDPSSGKCVALKAMHGALNRNEAARARFQAEVGILEELVHPNVVRSLGSSFLDGRMVMILEFLEGRTLRDVLRAERALPAARASWIGQQIARALMTAHFRPRPIIHRDLKPENIMILPDDTAKVMDFGVAKIVREIDAATMATRQVGTVRYMAPEQVEGRQISGKTDCYGLGLLLYEMLVGKAPFDGTTMVAILRAHCEEPPPPFEPALRNRTPKALEDLVFALLQKRAEDRPDAATAETALRALATAPGAVSPTTVAASTDEGAHATHLSAGSVPPGPTTVAAPLTALSAHPTPQAGPPLSMQPSSTQRSVHGSVDVITPERVRATPRDASPVAPYASGPVIAPRLDTVALVDRRARSNGPLIAAGVAVTLLVGGVVAAIVYLVTRAPSSSKSSRATATATAALTSISDILSTTDPTKSRVGMSEKLDGQPCGGTLCERLAAPNPKDVDVEWFIERATALARSEDPTASLVSVSFIGTLRDGRVDGTIDQGARVVRFTKSMVTSVGRLLILVRAPGNTVDPPVGARCTYDRALAGVRAASFPFTNATFAMLGAASNGTTDWRFMTDGAEARVDASCAVQVRR